MVFEVGIFEGTEKEEMEYLDKEDGKRQWKEKRGNGCVPELIFFFFLNFFISEKVGADLKKLWLLGSGLSTKRKGGFLSDSNEMK